MGIKYLNGQYSGLGNGSFVVEIPGFPQSSLVCLLSLFPFGDSFLLVLTRDFLSYFLLRKVQRLKDILSLNNRYFGRDCCNMVLEIQKSD